MNELAHNFQTAQEEFWASDFGEGYVSRNQGDALFAANLNYFVRSLRTAGKFTSAIEFGANIGMNSLALKTLCPGISLKAIEINALAAVALAGVIGEENITLGSILDYSSDETFELSFTKGVLIHINPEHLPIVYEKLYDASSRYILIGEYYNPTPMRISYRGHSDRLFKRDFAGEMLEKYVDLQLIDYGFCYRGDAVYPQDDITWFLLEKMRS